MMISTRFALYVLCMISVSGHRLRNRHVDGDAERQVEGKGDPQGQRQVYRGFCFRQGHTHSSRHGDVGGRSRQSHKQSHTASGKAQYQAGRQPKARASQRHEDAEDEQSWTQQAACLAKPSPSNQTHIQQKQAEHALERRDDKGRDLREA